MAVKKVWKPGWPGLEGNRVVNGLVRTRCVHVKETLDVEMICFWLILFRDLLEQAPKAPTNSTVHYVQVFVSLHVMHTCGSRSASALHLEDSTPVRPYSRDT